MGLVSKYFNRRLAVCTIVMMICFLFIISGSQPATAGRRIHIGGVYNRVKKSINRPYRAALTHISQQQKLNLQQRNAANVSTDEPSDTNIFKLEILTSDIDCTIRSIQASYDVEEQLALKVISTHPGWRLSLHASDLLFKNGSAVKGKILSSEVCLSNESGKFPLNRPVTVVSQGPANETSLLCNLAMVTTGFHRPGRYKGNLLIITQSPPDPSNGEVDTIKVCSPVMDIPIEVNVISRFQHEISGNKIYFHVGKPIIAPTMKATVNGHVEADTPISLNLESSERIDRLPQVKAMLGKDVNPDIWIPLQWTLAESGRPQRNPDSTSSNHRGVSWIIHGTPGAVDYDLDCAINPAAYQAPGDYGTSVTMTIKPIL